MELDDITRYRSLGWDFDMTLHGHERSPQFWDYIHENPHCQTHYIVTFRTGRLLDRIWYDLAEAGCRLLPFQFRGVHGVPDVSIRRGPPCLGRSRALLSVLLRVCFGAVGGSGDGVFGSRAAQAVDR